MEDIFLVKGTSKQTIPKSWHCYSVSVAHSLHESFFASTLTCVIWHQV